LGIGAKTSVINSELTAIGGILQVSIEFSQDFAPYHPFIDKGATGKGTEIEIIGQLLTDFRTGNIESAIELRSS
jgi:hypothetical protein